MPTKMNTLAIFFTLGLIVIVSAKPHFKDNKRKVDLSRLLFNLMEKRGDEVTPPEDTDESEMTCYESREISVPCLDIDSNDDFFKCALKEVRKTEDTFNRIFQEYSEEGKQLYRDEEMDFVYEIRTSSLVSMKVKEYTEMMVEELGYLRFTNGVDMDSMTEESMKELMDTRCIFSVIKAESYKRLKGLRE